MHEMIPTGTVRNGIGTPRVGSVMPSAGMGISVRGNVPPRGVGNTKESEFITQNAL